MGDPREVVPPPGTDPLVSKREIRRYREDADLYAKHRKEGTHPYTLDEVDARIRACAADLAAGKGEGPVSPPILRELVNLFWHRLFRDVPIAAEQRATFGLDLRKASTKANIAEERLVRADRRRRDLESERKRAWSPVTGTLLSQPWAILLCLIPGAVIEVFGSAPSLKIAFDISTGWARVFAVAISATLILAADQFGNALASAIKDSRRLAFAMAMVLLGTAVLSAGWAVTELAASRTTNLTRQAQLEAIESSGGDTGGFGGFNEISGPHSAAQERKQREDEEDQAAANRSKREAEIKELPSPSFSFFIPLSVLIMSTATLIAFRIETAREWNERQIAIADARATANEERVEEAQARQEANDATRPEDIVFQEASAYVEREHGVLTGWIERFRGEYQRFCSLEECQPRRIVEPRIPEPEEALLRLLYPRGAPEDAPRREPPDLEEEEPRHEGPGSGDNRPQGGPQRPKAGPDQQENEPRARREPPPQAPRQRRRPRRRDDEGRATGWNSFDDGDQ